MVVSRGNGLRGRGEVEITLTNLVYRDKNYSHEIVWGVCACERAL